MSFPINELAHCFATEPNQAILWHGRSSDGEKLYGGQDFALDYAKKNGGCTLEKCMLDHRDELEAYGVNFEELDDGRIEISYGDTDEENGEFWDLCSKSFTSQAQGDVRVLEGSDERLMKNRETGEIKAVSENDYPTTYKLVESPALHRNEKVDSITSIEPKNGEIKSVEQIKHDGDYREHDMLADLNNPNLFRENHAGNYKYEDGIYGKSASGSLKLQEGSRDAVAQRTVGGEDRRPDDDGGHLIGNRFGGSGGYENLDAQNYNANRGAYKAMEEKWEKHLQDGDKVYVHVETNKLPGSDRPEVYSGYYIVQHPDGTRELETFKFENENLKESEKWTAAGFEDDTEIPEADAEKTESELKEGKEIEESPETEEKSDTPEDKANDDKEIKPESEKEEKPENDKEASESEKESPDKNEENKEKEDAPEEEKSEADAAKEPEKEEDKEEVKDEESEKEEPLDLNDEGKEPETAEKDEDSEPLDLNEEEKNTPEDNTEAENEPLDLSEDEKQTPEQTDNAQANEPLDLNENEDEKAESVENTYENEPLDLEEDGKESESLLDKEKSLPESDNGDKPDESGKEAEPLDLSDDDEQFDTSESDMPHTNEAVNDTGESIM